MVFDRQGDDKRRPLPGCTFCGDMPPMSFSDLATDRQTHARAFIFAATVQPLKGVKDPVEVFFVETNAIIFDKKLAEFRYRCPPAG